MRDAHALSDAPGSGTDLDPGDRGSLEIRTRAVRRVAEHATGMVGGTVSSHRGALDRLRGGPYPRAGVRLERARAWIDLDVAARWPCAVEDLAARVRQEVLTETARITGLDVRRLDVTVHVVTGDDEPDQVRRVQ